MKQVNTPGILTFILIALSLTLSGCDLVGDIFEFGFWTAIITIAVVIAVVYFITKLFRK